MHLHTPMKSQDFSLKPVAGGITQDPLGMLAPLVLSVTPDFPPEENLNSNHCGWNPAHSTNGLYLFQVTAFTHTLNHSTNFHHDVCVSTLRVPALHGLKIMQLPVWFRVKGLPRSQGLHRVQVIRSFRPHMKQSRSDGTLVLTLL